MRKVLGYEPQIIAWRFSTDGEEAQAHTPDEQIPVANVVKAARVYAQLALDFLGG